jgi:hypothetical protein
MSRAALPILLLGLWGCAEPAPPPDQVDQPADSQTVWEMPVLGYESPDMSLVIFQK